MLTNRQVSQIKRQIGRKHGFLSETVDITNIQSTKKSVVVDGGRVEIDVDFSHLSGYWAAERFIVDVSDMRKMPVMVDEIRRG